LKFKEIKIFTFAKYFGKSTNFRFISKIRGRKYEGEDSIFQNKNLFKNREVLDRGGFGK